MRSSIRYSGQLLVVALAAILLLAVAGCGGQVAGFPSPQADVVAALRKGGAEPAAESAPQETAASGTGWGTISGTFVFDGTPPAPKTLSTGGKDAPTCNPNGIPDESLVVDSQSKGIKNIVVYARKVGRVNDEYAAKESQPVTFDQKNCMFLSHVVPVLVGEPVVLTNSEASVGHNTAISPPADKAANPLLPPGQKDEYKFGRAQNVPVPVTCSIHPWMKAYILPRDNPYFAVTDEKGHFEIKNVPAGENLEFQVWQEVAGGPQNAVVIPGMTDAKGRIVKKLAEGENVELGEVKVPASAFKL